MSTLTIQPANIDTYLYANDADGNFGSLLYLQICGSNWTSRILAKFDFSSLPVGATITDAILSLYVRSDTNAQDRTYWVYELTQTDWVELEATWNKYKTGNNWASAGGDYTVTNGASAIVPADNNWMNWNVLALVQHFQSAHSEVANFLLKDGNETSGDASYFHSREYTTDTSLCPKLVITYTVPQNYTFDAGLGSYAVTGDDSTPLAARMINAALASYTLIGIDITPIRTLLFNAGASSYALTGADAIPLADRMINAGPGSHDITGSDIAAIANRILSAGAGEFSVTGFDPSLLRALILNAASGAYDLTGFDANLVYVPVGAYSFNAAAGSYVISGPDAALLAARILALDPESYLLTGSDLEFALSGLGVFSLNAAPGTYVIVGSAARGRLDFDEFPQGIGFADTIMSLDGRIYIRIS